MATAAQITAAARKPKAPRRFEAVDVDAVDRMAGATEDDYPAARQYVKRLGNRHDCGEGCTSQDHAWDVNDCVTALIVLGLHPDPVPSVRRPHEISPLPDRPPVDSDRQRRWHAVQGSTAVTADHEWMSRAACRGEDLALFFGGDNERPPERAVREEKARTVCAGCPVRSKCLEYAVGGPKPQRYGIWGGLNEDERDGERRRRQRRAA